MTVLGQSIKEWTENPDRRGFAGSQAAGQGLPEGNFTHPYLRRGRPGGSRTAPGGRLRSHPDGHPNADYGRSFRHSRHRRTEQEGGLTPVAIVALTANARPKIPRRAGTPGVMRTFPSRFPSRSCSLRSKSTGRPRGLPRNRQLEKPEVSRLNFRTASRNLPLSILRPEEANLVRWQVSWPTRTLRACASWATT